MDKLLLKAIPPDTNGTQPTDFDFYLKASSITEAKAMLREDAAALGLSPKEVADITSRGTSVEQGRVKNWLSTEVEARESGNADGSMNLIYSVTIGRYYNEAVDKVLHHGRMHLDLTTRPSPADLAFQDAYDDADITPEFGHQLRISLTTPRGRITLPADSFTSSRTNGTVKTTIFIGLLDLTDSPTTARASAKVLGFDVAPALEIIRTANATLQTRYLECASTDVYTCAIRVQTVDDGTPHYGFIYRVTLTYR
ncbi:MAG: hypothetical protein EOO77_38475 [Oxalobacteraceae bacterium]|nr:MAG: hypothetical protein EOO77_38475 [Oxalobacteraceae bacterium]